MVEREDDRRRAQLDPLGPGGHVSEKQRRRWKDAEAGEVVLRNPGAVVPHGLGFDALLRDLEQQLVGIASIGAVTRRVVGQREVPELHRCLLTWPTSPVARHRESWP